MKKKKWIIVAVIVLLLVVIGAMSGGEDEPANANLPTYVGSADIDETAAANIDAVLKDLEIDTSKIEGFSFDYNDGTNSEYYFDIADDHYTVVLDSEGNVAAIYQGLTTLYPEQ